VVALRRALGGVAVLLTATASPTFAGYILLRVLLEGGPADTAPAGPGQPGRPAIPSKGPTQMPAGPPATPGAHGEGDPKRSVVVAIPIADDFKSKHIDWKAQFFNPKDNPSYKHVVVPYYAQKLHASLFVDSTSIQLYEQLITTPGPRKTVTTQLSDKYDLWRRGGKKEPRLLYDAFVFAMEAGIIHDPIPTRDGNPAPDAMSLAQEMLDVAADGKLQLAPEFDRFVKAWGQMSPRVKKPLQQNAELMLDANTWQARIGADTTKLKGHYAIVYWDRETTDAELNRRATQLNDNFEAFYLLHATRGIVLPVPDKPLLVVLAKQGQDIHRLFPALDGLPKNTDAFYAPDHNILVLSPEPLDDVTQTFLRQNQQVFNKGFNRANLLAGTIPKLDHKGEKGAKPDDVARANTLALVERLVIDEAEIAAVSHEGSRQLLFTTGALPQHVTLPNWLTIGALNTFTRPRGPAFITVGDDEKPYVAVAFATGYGVPNYVLQRHFTEMGDRSHNELNPDPVALLENVLSDAYFNGLKGAIDPDPAPPKKVKKPAPKEAKDTTQPPPGGLPPPKAGPAVTVIADDEDPAVTLRKKRARLNIKANATAWALYYFLARAKPNELKAYVSELNQLPRDLPIDGATAYKAFIRVFDLSATRGGPADPARMKKFAKEWLEYIASVPTVSYDVPLAPPEPPKKDDPKNPNPKAPFPPK
jgi:hypothetical protein